MKKEKKRKAMEEYDKIEQLKHKKLWTKQDKKSKNERK